MSKMLKMIAPDFVNLVVNAYNNGDGIFATKINAEELVPAWLDDLGKAQFLFYVLQLDYEMRSQVLYSGVRRLCSEIPHFFTPNHITRLSDSELTSYLKNYLHPRYANEALKRYRIN